MEIREARPEDFEELKEFYTRMNEVIHQRGKVGKPENPVYPTDEMIKEAIAQRGQFIGIEDGRIVIACMVRNCFEEAYSKVHWRVDAAENENWILHALRTDPEYEGRGFAKQMIGHIIELAPKRGQKAIRLDVKEDYPVTGLYTRFGFEYVETVEAFYPDIGCVQRFMMFEKRIV